MNESVLKRICYEMLFLNGKNWGIVCGASKEKMQESMADPKNLLEFLSVFGKVTNLKLLRCADSMSCDDCKRYTSSHSDCIKSAIQSIADKYPPKKFRTVFVNKESQSHIFRVVLPGEFPEEKARSIVKMYDDDRYIVEEVNE